MKKGENGEKIEYRVWNPFRSKLAAAILGGVDQIHIKPGAKVLYLGAASGTTVSHVSDIVGPVKYFFYFLLTNISIFKLFLFSRKDLCMQLSFRTDRDEI